MPQIKDITNIARFEPAIKLQEIAAAPDNAYFRDYILTEELADLFRQVLASVLNDQWGAAATALPSTRHRSHLITAQYGAGKSYFMLMLSAILDAAGDEGKLQLVKDKFQRFSEFNSTLNQLRGGQRRFVG